MDIGCAVELRGYGYGDAIQSTSGIYINGILTILPTTGVTLATLTMTNTSCVVGSVNASIQTHTSGGKTLLINSLMDLPNGTIVLGISTGNTVASGGTLTGLDVVDAEYGTKFMELRYRGTLVFVAKKGDRSFAHVYLCGNAQGPLHFALECMPFAKGKSDYNNQECN